MDQNTPSRPLKIETKIERIRVELTSCHATITNTELPHAGSTPIDLELGKYCSVSS